MAARALPKRQDLVLERPTAHTAVGLGHAHQPVSDVSELVRVADDHRPPGDGVDDALGGARQLEALLARSGRRPLPEHDRRLYAAPRAELTIDVARTPGTACATAVRSTRCRRRGFPPINDFAAMAGSIRQHRHGGEKWEQYTCTSS